METPRNLASSNRNTLSTVRYYVPKQPVLEWWEAEREFRRYGYDPYNSLDAFRIWQRHHEVPE